MPSTMSTSVSSDLFSSTVITPSLPTFCIAWAIIDRKSTRLNSSHGYISYAVFCLKKKKNTSARHTRLKRCIGGQIAILNTVADRVGPGRVHLRLNVPHVSSGGSGGPDTRQRPPDD